MLPYLITFSVSSMFIYAYEKNKRYKILLFLGILLPCILAALRANNIGTDINVYAMPLFKKALMSSSFSEYLKLGWYDAKSGYWFITKSFEIGYTLLAYICAKYFNNFQVLLFVTSILIIFPVYFGAKNFNFIKNNKIIWLAMAIFYALIYNFSLNGMRQSIAAAILFYAISIYINKEFKNKLILYLLLVLTACLFHKSAIIGLFYIMLYSLTKKNVTIKYLSYGNQKISIPTAKFLLTILVCSLFLLLPNLLKSTISSFSTIIGKDYSGYVWSSVGMVRTTFLILPMLFLLIIQNKKIDEIESKYYLITTFILYIITIQFGATTSYGARISVYFQFFNVITYSMIYNSINSKLIKYLFMIYLTIWWVYFLVNGDTYPYIFC